MVARLSRWQRLLSQGSLGLLEDKQLSGLCAELNFLLSEAIVAVGPRAAVAAWKGPYDAPKDFVFDFAEVEIKAVHQQPRAYCISSLEQMTDNGKPLYLWAQVVDLHSAGRRMQNLSWHWSDAYGPPLCRIRLPAKTLKFDYAWSDSRIAPNTDCTWSPLVLYHASGWHTAFRVSKGLPLIRVSCVANIKSMLKLWSHLKSAHGERRCQMPKELDAFLIDLNQEVTAAANAQGSYTRTVLVENLVGRLVEAEELQDWTPAFFDGRGQRRRLLGIDGYSVDELELDGTLQLIIAQPKDGNAVEELGTAEVNSAFDRALAFVSDAREGRLQEQIEPSTPAADLARLIHESRESLKTVRVHLISNAALGSRYKMATRKNVDSIKVELHIWDLVRFQRLADVGGREEIDIDVTRFIPNGIPSLARGIGGTNYQAFLCVVPGAFLADVYEEYGSRILEGNVRAFLSARGKVNQGIRKTILAQPDRFFAFNNGITATASRVDFGQNGSIVRLMDLQVVNGGQTTASLFNTRFGDKTPLDGIYVQMKLSVLPPDIAMVMIPEISRYANTQNKVSDADLFANHPFNRKVEEISRRLWAQPREGMTQMTHWFYERARAQYQTEQIKLTAGQKKAFLLQNPKHQVITKTDLAKYENSYKKLPNIVSLGAQKNFIRYAEDICGAYDSRPKSLMNDGSSILSPRQFSSPKPNVLSRLLLGTLMLTEPIS